MKTSLARKEKDRKYREAHREQIRERDRIYRKTHPDETKKSQRKWRERNPDYKSPNHGKKKYPPDKEYTRKYLRFYNYGVSDEEYEKMFSSQNGLCAICGEDQKLCVDHDHATKKVRGLLCSKCNAAIGLLKDSPVVLTNAVRYLERQSVI